MSQPELRQMSEQVVYAGKIGEVIHTIQPDGRVFERYRRPPGVRIIAVTPEGKILMTREHRQETGGYDLRLPGGKVCDSLSEYHQLLASGQSVEQAAIEAARKEGRQEIGIDITESHQITNATDGATVEWDLRYIMVDRYDSSPNGQELELGEDITVVALSPAEVRQAIADGDMQEWRSVVVMLAVVLPQLEAKPL